ncbi:nucleotidyltransferase family protein [candidate division NPL-UPA2 bacterium]|nr:nucleotidyltransferase family protein [candidate division NPL-UPA2 bacterium]
MKKLPEIQAILRLHRERLNKEYRVSEIGIFGSFVRDEQKATSDVDILVSFEEVPDLLKFIELERLLEELLGLKVDLVEKTSVRPELKDIILNEAVPA